MVRIASVWVPFNSESKEAIAHDPEIIKELRLGLQECGRKVAIHIRRRRRQADEQKKLAYIERYIPQLAIGLEQILGPSERQKNDITKKLGGVLERSRKMSSPTSTETRATRRFIRKLSDDCKLPVYAFVDCDPHGISNIYRTLKVGSGNAAHPSQFFCVPNARFLGVTPQDIIDYQLPTHPLQEVDIKRAKDALKNDPFFKSHKAWQDAIGQLLEMGVRAEQQALAMWGLNYVIEEYLPAKLAHRGAFLP